MFLSYQITNYKLVPGTGSMYIFFTGYVHTLQIRPDPQLWCTIAGSYILCSLHIVQIVAEEFSGDGLF